MPKTPPAKLRAEDYAHSPAHHAVVTRDHAVLTRLVSSLPRLPISNDIGFPRTESESLELEKLADQISSVLDRRDDITFRETPLHLAVRLSDLSAVRTLAGAGADVSLQNSAGWNPLQEALCRHSSEIALVLLQHHHLSAWAKWRRRLPRLVAALRRMRDFYMEISFHFESSFVPFVGKIAPSDTYRIWKREGKLRADTSLSGFDGMKVQRTEQSFLFLGDGDPEHGIAEGSLLVLNREERRIFDAFENAGGPVTEGDVASLVAQTSVYRPGMDVTKAEVVPRLNWRRQEKAESVGEWKAKVYDVQNVVFSFRSRKISGSEQVIPLELDEESEEGFLVMENPICGSDKRRHSSYGGRQEKEWITVNRKSVDINLVSPRRASVASAAPPPVRFLPRAVSAAPVAATKEKEFVKGLKPSVWLTEQFPLKTEEILPLLDILANKVKAVRRMRELLTTKFPQGTFPVKIAIPVVPTVRVVITFAKFVELPPTDEFYTPLSSPTQLNSPEQQQTEEEEGSISSGWFSRSNSRNTSSSSTTKQQLQEQCFDPLQSEPFAIPSGYRWTNTEYKTNKLKKTKSVRKSK